MPGWPNGDVAIASNGDDPALQQRLLDMAVGIRWTEIGVRQT